MDDRKIEITIGELRQIITDVNTNVENMVIAKVLSEFADNVRSCITLSGKPEDIENVWKGVDAAAELARQCAEEFRSKNKE